MIKPYTLEIQIPDRLKGLLIEAAGGPEVLRAVAEFSVWLSDNKTPLFFDYTDHGVAHVTNVLASVERLIPDAAWEPMSPQDAEALIAAVLLHDCAMHLSVDGFWSLLRSESPKSMFIAGGRSWASEYKRFEQEALRWDSKRLVSVFGDADPIDSIQVEGPISDRQKLLVGEFMRRNHARLAHEIALSGVPSVGEVSERFAPLGGLPEKKRDLYGFLARSHNMSIRDAVDRLPKLSRRQYLEVHCPYVMALLRVADYIQIDAARAPTQILQLRGLKSPVSRQEWAKHHAVLELHQQGDDPEALHVIADPKTVSVFVGLRSLFKDLQRELDESWANLGEVYGRFEQLADLGLSVRRLVSNLDDPNEFEAESQPPYLPAEVRLTTSSAELLHLLVGPLYGNKPSVGIRELIQNAVDACMEMQHQSLSMSTSYDPLIEVEIDAASADRAVVRITDNGVGMTIDTLRDYFLTAGASFRRSAWWATEYSDEKSCSKVRRSGRFGVGSLAAFLVGQRMSVVTRSYTDTTGFGYEFSLGADDDLIEIRRVKCEVGTSIKIPVTNKDVVKEFVKRDSDFSDWYVYDSPRIIYRVNECGDWSERTPDWVVRSDQADWVEFCAPGFERVRWRRMGESRRRGGYGRLACNGIYVTHADWGRSLPRIKISKSLGAFNVQHPDLLVDDKDGRFPLNVQRDGLVDTYYPFQRELEASIAGEFVRRIVSSIQHAARPANIRACALQMHPVTRELGGSRLTPVAIWDGGWVPMDADVFKELGIKSYLLDYCDNNSYGGLISSLEDDEVSGWALVPLCLDSQGVGAVIGRLRNLIEGQRDSLHHLPYSVGEVEGVRIFLRDYIFDAANKKGGVPGYLMRSVNIFGKFNGWTVLDIGDTAGLDGDCDWVERCNALLSKDNQNSRMFAFARYKELAAVEESPIRDAWRSAVQGSVLRPNVDPSSEPSFDVELYEVGEEAYADEAVLED